MSDKKSAETVAKISHAVQEQLTECLSLLDRLHQLADHALQKGLPIDYVEISTTILENFIPYVYEDLKSGEYERALEGSYALFELGKIAVGELDEIASGQLEAISVPRYQTSDIYTEGASFHALTIDSGDGLMAHRPVFFTGYGRFAQVHKDITKFPRYGVNLIQVEISLHSVFPDESTTSDADIQTFLKTLDRAQSSNVAVSLLINPCAFPDWALEKYPHLKQCGGGSLKFCMDAPESREIIERFIRHVIPQISEQPGLHSICLKNEPIYRQSDQCKYVQTAWRDWLEHTHGDVKQLNRRYKAKHADFSDIPIPKEPLQPTPLYYDWSIFNHERLAGWHGWMADLIHGISPDLHVHANMVNWNPFERGNVTNGGDAELLSQFSDASGNDCRKWYLHLSEGEWENEWQIENMEYDLQRSVGGKPIFNSENHLIRNGDLEDIPSVHIRNVLWQGAIHGQSATAIWVWERTLEQEGDFAGSIMHRPGCVAMVGMTHLDLMRFSEEVSLIQNLKPEIGILYSTSSIIYSDAHLENLKRTYQALNFTGIKIGFVTERMLAAGTLADYKSIVVPQATHITAEAHRALQDYVTNGGRLISIGTDCLRRDAYDTQHVPEDRLQITASFSTDLSPRELWETFEEQLEDWGIFRRVNITSKERERVWGVEYLTAHDEGRLIVNLVNYTREMKRVYLQIHGHHQIKNLLMDQKIRTAVDLEVLNPVLLEIQ